MKAAHTEARATLSTIHTAQALYLTDNNKYAEDIDKELNITISPDALYEYRDDVSGTKGKVNVPTAGGGVEFFAVAVAKNKLASCAVAPAAKDTWCLDHDKVLTNVKEGKGDRKTNDNGVHCGPSNATRTVYGGCEARFN